MARRWERTRRARSVLAVLVAGLLGAAAALAAINLMPPVSGEVGPGTFTVGANLDGDGGTRVSLAPLGRIRAATHDGPMRLVVRLDEIDVPEAQRLARSSDPELELRAQVESDLGPLSKRFATRALVVGLAASLVAGLLLPHRRLRLVLASALGGVLVLVGVGYRTWASFDPDAFDSPELSGPLAAAPRLLDTVRRHVDDIDEVESRFEQLSSRLANLYVSLEPDTSESDEGTVILHVSDIHSNPVGLGLVAQAAAAFDVDAVRDTGDLTSFGVDVESRVVDLLGGIDVPYVLVPGNHDSFGIRADLAAAGVTVLDGTVVDVGGVEILGFGELVYTVGNGVPRRHWDAANAAQAEDIAATARRVRPDVVAAHSEKQLTESWGVVPVLAAGHDHRPEIIYRDGTVMAKAGTAGAHGLEALMVERDFNYQMQLLRFVEGRLVAVDRIIFRGVDGGFRLERILIDPNQIDAYPDVERVEASDGPLGPLLDPDAPITPTDPTVQPTTSLPAG